MLNYKDKLVLLQILEFIDEVEEIIGVFGKNFIEFQDNVVFKNALSMSIMQIGELKNSLSEDFLISYEGYFEWDRLRRFRNLLAHDYTSIENENIWGFAIRRVPELREAIERVLFEEKMG